MQVTGMHKGKINTYLENWIAPKLTGNARKGQERLRRQCERLWSAHRRVRDSLVRVDNCGQALDLAVAMAQQRSPTHS